MLIESSHMINPDAQSGIDVQCTIKTRIESAEYPRSYFMVNEGTLTMRAGIFTFPNNIDSDPNDPTIFYVTMSMDRKNCTIRSALNPNYYMGNDEHGNLTLREGINEESNYKIFENYEGTYFLQSTLNNCYICCEENRTSLTCNRIIAGSWEKFYFRSVRNPINPI